MSTIMVRYKVKPERAEENEQLVRAVYEELARTAPAGLRYATFKLDDGVSFVHIAAIDTANGQNPLREVEAFQAFQKEVSERCAEPPVSCELHEVGSFNVR
jgi:quinol monooxygenase YgiN